MGSYAVLGSGLSALRPKCSPNRLNTHGNILWAVTRFLGEVIGSQTQMLPELFKYVTGNIVGSYAVLGRGQSVLRPKCSLNLLNTSRGAFCGLLRVSWERSIVAKTQMFPESFKYVTGEIVGSYAFLARGISFLRTKCFPNLLNTSRGTYCGLLRVSWERTIDSQTQIFPESLKYATGNILRALTRFLGEQVYRF